jgi:hypothetical protein
MHITYRYQEYTIYINMNNNNSAQQQTSISTKPSMSYETWLSSVHNRIDALKKEQRCIMEIATKLSYYLHRNAISLYNDDLLGYLELFVQEEQMKLTVDGNNQSVVKNLKRLADQYKEDVDFLKKTEPKLSVNERITAKAIQSVTAEVGEVFDLVKNLYALPINGSLIRDQVEGLKRGQNSKIGDNEIEVNVPLDGPIGSVVQQLDSVFSPSIQTFF